MHNYKYYFCASVQSVGEIEVLGVLLPVLLAAGGIVGTF